jgi:hypothetical protein
MRIYMYKHIGPTGGAHGAADSKEMKGVYKRKAGYLYWWISVSIYLYLCTSFHVDMHIHIYIYVSICKLSCIYISMHEYRYRNFYVCLHVYTYINIIIHRLAVLRTLLESDYPLLNMDIRNTDMDTGLETLFKAILACVEFNRKEIYESACVVVGLLLTKIRLI